MNKQEDKQQNHSNPYENNLKLGIAGYKYEDLYRPERLRDLMESFSAQLNSDDENLYERHQKYLDNQGENFDKLELSELLIALAPHVSRFIARLFQVEAERDEQKAASLAILEQLAGKKKKANKTDFSQLVNVETLSGDQYEYLQGPRSNLKRRDGFNLTDNGYDDHQTLCEVDYCIYCHQTNTDYCAHGMRNKRSGEFRSNPLGVIQSGCPLEERISEMHQLKRDGDNIAALAIIMIDNPMCPGTGHRICNDCMKSCIYQKREPVNIPQIETKILKDVLSLPYGFEIYCLLSRWNPLNAVRPYALPYNGRNVLVVGLGPAGYTLSHYLLNEGCAVIGIDALKIEPLPSELTGSDQNPPAAIKDVSMLHEELGERTMLGFGGVAEYGITSRWDKNFLKLIYLSLARRNAFLCYGGIRFGGTINIDDAWKMGVDHIAIAAGAGRPTMIGMRNNMARGIRQASDFLMALQLTGAAKSSSLANMQIRLPAGVIGGGLTAVDATTELMAYYPLQVERILDRYEKVCKHLGDDHVNGTFDTEEKHLLEEYLAHGRAIRSERQRAEAANEAPDFLPLLQSWGGVTLLYRKRMQDAPAYRDNHEEIIKAMEEGLIWAQELSPLEAKTDEYGHLQSVAFEKMRLQEGKWKSTGESIDIPLRSLIIAAGTSPNITYEDEYPGSFTFNGKYFQRHELITSDSHASNEPSLQPTDDTAKPKIARPAPFTSYNQDGRYISYYGDNHPVYAGNVVKAMASAKDSFAHVMSLFKHNTDDQLNDVNTSTALTQLKEQWDKALGVTLLSVERLTSNILELVVHANMQAHHFQPGQFYRVQNYETLARTIDGTRLASEALALTGARVDKQKGIISLIVLELGSSSRLCALWQSGDPLVVMGVTGAPTEIPSNKKIMLLGGGLGNAVLLSIGRALRAAGNDVLYFAGYKSKDDLFKQTEIEAAADVVVWSVDPLSNAEKIIPARSQDKSYIGNIVQSMLAYAQGDLGETPIALSDVDHIIVIGSNRMMEAVRDARYGALKAYLKTEHTAIASINSPMQCMMKGVCAQCLCKQVDPQSGKESYVYSCFNQDQNLDHVDFDNLSARLQQNSLMEKLSDMWLTCLLDSE